LLSVVPYLFIAGAEGGCTPDGDYQLTYDDFYYTPWTRSSLWAINIKFGSYDFASVKMIDVAWAMACCLRTSRLAKRADTNYRPWVAVANVSLLSSRTAFS
jgi:hypothetical protein